MFDWIDWAKLRHEWKTLAVAIAGIIIEGYDAATAVGLIDAIPIKTLLNIPPDYQPLVSPTILFLMLLLRKWRDANVAH